MKLKFTYGDVVVVDGRSMADHKAQFLGVIRDIDHDDDIYPYWIENLNSNDDDDDYDNGWYGEDSVWPEPDEVPL